jgi:hypothetical protein
MNQPTESNPKPGSSPLAVRPQACFIHDCNGECQTAPHPLLLQHCCQAGCAGGQDGRAWDHTQQLHRGSEGRQDFREVVLLGS